MCTLIAPKHCASELVISFDCHIEQIPVELILKILKYLDVNEMNNFKSTCRKFREITFLLPLNSAYKVFDGVLRFGPVDDNFKTLLNSKSYSLDFLSKIFMELIEDENLDLEKIRLFLTDERVIIKEMDNFGDIVRKVIKNHHFDAANLLLSYSDANFNFSNLIIDDIRIGISNLSLVTFLLKYPMISSTDNKNKIILFSSKYGRTDIIELLLTDNTIDPSYNENYAFKTAIETGQLEVVRLLLNDLRVCLSLDFAEAIFLAEEGLNEYKDIADLLRSHLELN